VCVCVWMICALPTSPDGQKRPSWALAVLPGCGAEGFPLPLHLLVLSGVSSPRRSRGQLLAGWVSGMALIKRGDGPTLVLQESADCCRIPTSRPLAPGRRPASDNRSVYIAGQRKQGQNRPRSQPQFMLFLAELSGFSTVNLHILPYA